MSKFFVLRFAAAISIVVTNAALTNVAQSADLRVPPKPVVQQPATPEWKLRLFEEFQRWLLNRT